MGKWRCVSHKSVHGSSSPWLAKSQHHAEQRAESELRARTLRTTNTAPNLAYVDDRLFVGATRRERVVQTGLCRYVYTLLSLTQTQSCFYGCFLLQWFLSFSTSFPHKFIGVWCDTVLSVQRCSVLRK